MTWCRQLGQQDVSPRTNVMEMKLGTSVGTSFPKKYGMAEVTTGSWSAGTAVLLKKDGDLKIKVRGQEGSQSMGCDISESWGELGNFL